MPFAAYQYSAMNRWKPTASYANWTRPQAQGNAYTRGQGINLQQAGQGQMYARAGAGYGSQGYEQTRQSWINKNVWGLNDQGVYDRGTPAFMQQEGQQRPQMPNAHQQASALDPNLTPGG